MAIQTSTTGQFENASREMISQLLFVQEHNSPMENLVEKFRLEQGSDTMVIPKVGQITLDSLTEGQDIVDAKDLGMTTTSVTTSEVGGKVILTDRLLRRNAAINWGSTGRQLGDAAARRTDEDLVALFSALNGGSDLGAAGRVLSAANYVSAVGFAKHNKFGSDLRVVHHPSAILRLSRDLSVIGLAQTNQYPIPNGFSATKLQKFWTGIRLGGVPAFETGNIPTDGGGDAIGSIFDRSAIGLLRSKGWNRERERDASLRAWELVITADYAAFEHDDARGAPLTMDAAEPVTT